MALKLYFIVAACLFILVDASASCPKPKKYMRKYTMKRFRGTWHTQGLYDTLATPLVSPTCGTVQYKMKGKRQATSKFVSKKPCNTEPETTVTSKLVKNRRGGKLTASVINPDTGKPVLNAPCYIIAGKSKSFMTIYCCKEFKQQNTTGEALVYYTRSANAEPDLAMEMHEKAIKSGLDDPASKVIFLAPESCAPQ